MDYIADNFITNWQDVCSHICSAYPREAGGVVQKDGTFVALTNIAEDDNDCVFDPKEFRKIKNKRALIHSHVLKQDQEYDARTPSFVDLQTQINLDLECGIVVTDGQACEQPVWWGNYEHRPDLMKREFIHGIQDCLSFVADWYYQNQKIELPLFAREPGWSQGPNPKNYFIEQYHSWGFEDIDVANQVGDVVFFKIQSQVVNHVGVYIGDGKVAHHLIGGLPRIDRLAVWQKHGSIDRYARYKR